MKFLMIILVNPHDIIYDRPTVDGHKSFMTICTHRLEALRGIKMFA